MRSNENLYLLQDGTYADPKDCKKGDDGVLRHDNGVGVALRDDGKPMTLARVTQHNVDAIEAAAAPDEPMIEPVAPEQAPRAPEVKAEEEPPPPAARDVKAE